MKGSIIFVEASRTGAGEMTCAYARHQNLEVILLTGDALRYPHGLTAHCHRIIETDTTSIAAMISALEATEAHHNIVAITTTSDFFVIQAAVLAKYYKLPANPPDVVATLRNKHLMRTAIEKYHPHLNPLFQLTHSITDALSFAERIGFPFIAKPINGNDSLHVVEISNKDGLEKYFQERDAWGDDASGQRFEDGILLEELIGGEEFCLDILKPLDQDFIVMGAFKKIISRGSGDRFVKIGACFPSSDTDTSTLSDHIIPLLKKIGFAVGAADIDCKIIDGKVKILEINPRLVGDQMGSHMIELSTGQNPAHAVVDLAQGKPYKWSPTKNCGVAIHRLTLSDPGYFLGIENEKEITSHSGVEKLLILGQPNTWYEPATSNQGVVGSIIVSQETANQAFELAQKVADQARISLVSSLI